MQNVRWKWAGVALAAVAAVILAAGGAPTKKPPKKKKTSGQEIDNAIAAGLDWLHRHIEKPGGRWSATGFSKKCEIKDEKKDKPCSNAANMQGGQYDTGITALAVMAFLGNNYCRMDVPYGMSALQGIGHLKGRVGNNGAIGSQSDEKWMYNQLIATQALCEAYILTRTDSVEIAAKKAVKFILDAQNPGSGWGYKPKDGKPNTSVTAWALCALHAAKQAGFNVPRSAFSGGLAWFAQMLTPTSGGIVSYAKLGDRTKRKKDDPKTPFRKLHTVSAAAAYAVICAGKKKSDSKFKRAVGIIIRDTPEWLVTKEDCPINFYYWYFATNAMYRAGSSKWKKWKKPLHETLVGSQCTSGCARGSWDPAGEWCSAGGRVYATAMAVLALQTSYRHTLIEKYAKRLQGK